MSRGRDDDDRPRRREDDDFDDDEDADRGRPRRRRELSGLDKMYADTSVVVLVLFGLCCGLIALILSAVAVGVCTDERARSNAKMTLIISIITTVVGVGIQVVSLMSQNNPAFR